MSFRDFGDENRIRKIHLEFNKAFPTLEELNFQKLQLEAATKTLEFFLADEENNPEWTVEETLSVIDDMENNKRSKPKNVFEAGLLNLREQILQCMDLREGFLSKKMPLHSLAEYFQERLNQIAVFIKEQEDINGN